MQNTEENKTNLARISFVRDFTEDALEGFLLVYKNNDSGIIKVYDDGFRYKWGVGDKKAEAWINEYNTLAESLRDIELILKKSNYKVLNAQLKLPEDEEVWNKLCRLMINKYDPIDCWDFNDNQAILYLAGLAKNEEQFVRIALIKGLQDGLLDKMLDVSYEKYDRVVNSLYMGHKEAQKNMANSYKSSARAGFNRKSK